jgi:hypothetical protein
MIPILILLGLIFGRWWLAVLVAAGIGWPVLLMADGVLGFGQALAAAGLAILNTGVGVLIHQGLLWAFRRMRQAWARRSRP